MTSPVDPSLMTEADIETDVEEMYAAAQLPKREGGLGPLKKKHATKERIRRCIVAARQTAITCKGDGKSREETLQEAVKTAEDAEKAYSGLIVLVITAIISGVIQWIVKRWMDRRFPE